MSSNLNTVPPKGILKRKSSSHNNGEHGSSDSSESRGREPKAKFDEMNILETLHPADKDYGHMKIEEPKTPYHYDREDGVLSQESQNSATGSGLDPEMLAKIIEQKGNDPPRRMSDDDDDDGLVDPVTAEQKKKFANARKKHYNEFCNIKLARQLIEQEDDEDTADGSMTTDKKEGGNSIGAVDVNEEDLELTSSTAENDNSTNVMEFESASNVASETEAQTGHLEADEV